MSSANITRLDRVAPLTRWLPRGHMKVASMLGLIRPDDVWADANTLTRTFYDHTLGCRVTTDIAHWTGRLHYLEGCYLDGMNRQLIDAFLRPGDLYVDVGAAWGWHAIYAGRRVGPDGRVMAFEPNPTSMARCREHVHNAGLTDRVSFHDCALSDTDGRASLNAEGSHVSADTLRPTQDTGHGIDIRTLPGDDVLPDWPDDKRALIKIDTEGSEWHVLSGMSRWLARPGTAFSVEITDNWLNRMGHSAAALFALMAEHDQKPMLMETRWRWGIRPYLALTPIDRPANHRWQYDVLFMHPNEHSLLQQATID